MLRAALSSEQGGVREGEGFGSNIGEGRRALYNAAANHTAGSILTPVTCYTLLFCADKGACVFENTGTKTT